jgi:hypothetical protein
MHSKAHTPAPSTAKPKASKAGTDQKVGRGSRYNHPATMSRDIPFKAETKTTPGTEHD